MAAAASGITFTVAAGPCAGQVFSFTAADTVVVGRKKGCSMWLKDPSVSERHAQLWYTGGAWHLADEGSTNGTHLARLGEACIKGEHYVLQDGDVIRFGNTSRMLVSLQGSEDARAGMTVEQKLQADIQRLEASVMAYAHSIVDQMQRSWQTKREELAGLVN